MSKCFVGINKIKNLGTLKSRWNHDINKEFRNLHVDNADSTMYEENDILVSCTDDEGKEISYDKAVKNRLKDLKQEDGRKIRTNAVLAYDIVLEFGDMDDIIEDDINVDEWEKRSVEWLKETFNVAGDGKDNVLSVVCHKDESSPHIHAIVTPVDERGCLCARSFTNGSYALSQFQSSYANKLKDLGIERGIPGSSAHHKPNRKYNAEKKKAAKLPDPLPNESALSYLQKFQEELELRAVAQKESMDKLERNLRARNDKLKYEQKLQIDQEIDVLKSNYEYEIKEYTEEIERLTTQVTQLTKQIEQLVTEKDELTKETYNLEEMQFAYEKYTFLQNAILHLNKENKPLADDIIHLHNVAENIYQEYLDNSKTNSITETEDINI